MSEITREEVRLLTRLLEMTCTCGVITSADHRDWDAAMTAVPRLIVKLSATTDDKRTALAETQRRAERRMMLGVGVVVGMILGHAFSDWMDPMAWWGGLFGAVLWTLARLWQAANPKLGGDA